MKASRLVEILQRELEEHDDFEILITTHDGGIGCQSYTTFDFAAFGFDWESNQFRIHPKDRLVKEKKHDKNSNKI